MSCTPSSHSFLAVSLLPLLAAGVFGATVPVNKNLDSNWIKSLSAKGTQTVYTGDSLITIGMPCGGICAGQLYVRGDGTLAKWWIFDNAVDAGNEYATVAMRPPSPIDQGFSITTSIQGADTARPAIMSVTTSSDNHSVVVLFSKAVDTVSAKTVSNYSIDNGVTISSALVSANGFAVTLTTSALTNGITYTLTANNIKDRATPPNTMVANTKKQFQYYLQLTNNDFETDNLSGWTVVSGTAFSDNSVTNLATALGGDGETFGQHGTYHVWGFNNGGDAPMGVMRSSTFTVEGTGQLDFLMSGGNDIVKLYVALVRASDNTILFKATGNNSETYRRVTWDASSYLGTPCFFQVVDSSNAAWGHINVDDFDIGPAAPADTVANTAGTMRLDQSGFNAIQFTGEYPIATIKYVTTAMPKPPVDVTLEVFSPYIPLNSKESGLPATVMHFTVVNSSSNAVNATLTGWLKDTRVVLQLMQSGGSLKGSPTNDVDTAFSLNPGEKKDLTFLVAWYMAEDRFMYDNWFTSDTDVTKYVAANYDRLYAQTHLFHDTYYNTTLPYWFVQRVSMPLSVLATETSQWWKSGRFWAWEGVKCCSGVCTHVYNYAQAMSHIFPDLERNVRLQTDLSSSAGFNANGLVGMRSDGEYAADGQCGAILKVYREHLMSADTSFLRTAWPNTKKAMEYTISHDPDTNGIIEDAQPQTYDCAYGGPNTFVGSLYLAALRSAEEMARTMNDTASASRYHRIFVRGKAWTEQNLFKNGYFYQIVNNNVGGSCAYGTGSLADQLFGQTWADQLNLGYIYSKDSISKAFESIYSYNWAPDVNGIEYGRTFANSGEAGLIIATWPFGNGTSQNYSGEIWTGIEYQVATGMIYEGKLDEALIIIRGIHDRYNGAKHNPWNEVECSEHYSRAMASWGALLAMSGYQYNGPAGAFAFAPKMNQTDFRSFFSAAQGWGSIVQRRDAGGQENDIELKYGSLSLKSLVFDVPANLQGQSCAVYVNNSPVAAAGAVVNNQYVVTLTSPIAANAGDIVKFTIGNAVGARQGLPGQARAAFSVRVRSGVCTIACNIPHAVDLSVKLFDLKGKLAGNLYGRRVDKGSYDLRFDLGKNGRKINAGFYIMKISTSDGFVLADKLMLQ